MDIYEVIRTRRSIRSYSEKPIPEDILLKVLEAARIAPSANNIQPWKFIVVKEKAGREEVALACMGQRFIGEAPVVVVACGLPTPSKIGGYASSVLVDVAIAMDHLTLAARAEGLGTCWIGAFDNGVIKRLLAIPDDVQVVAVTPLGYSEGGFRGPGRRNSLSEILASEKYNRPYPVRE